MNQDSAALEQGTLIDNLTLATWNRERSSEELVSFITSKHLALPDDIEIE